MTYEELKAAYEAAVQKCSELEKENDELKKSTEDQALHIEHLEEQILKRNKMLDVKSLIFVRFFQLIIFFFKLGALLHSGFICCFQFFVRHSKNTPFPEIPDGS